MTRRAFLVVALFPGLAVAKPRKLKKYVFKIKTKDGSVVSNILIEAFDLDGAKIKLHRRYPDCEILESREK